MGDQNGILEPHIRKMWRKCEFSYITDEVFSVIEVSYKCEGQRSEPCELSGSVLKLSPEARWDIFYCDFRVLPMSQN
jgi:hypothetical protein